MDKYNNLESFYLGLTDNNEVCVVTRTCSRKKYILNKRHNSWYDVDYHDQIYILGYRVTLFLVGSLYGMTLHVLASDNKLYYD